MIWKINRTIAVEFTVFLPLDPLRSNSTSKCLTILVGTGKKYVTSVGQLPMPV